MTDYHHIDIALPELGDYESFKSHLKKTSQISIRGFRYLKKNIQNLIIKALKEEMKKW